jgi:amino acid permease
LETTQEISLISGLDAVGGADLLSNRNGLISCFSKKHHPQVLIPHIITKFFKIYFRIFDNLLDILLDGRV